MPIRINLLAEAHAAEEERRRDPVKRAIAVAVFLVLLVLLWSSSLQVKLLAAKGSLRGLQARWRSIEQAYQLAGESQRQIMEAEQKMAALGRLHTNRFLWGTALNAFQQTLRGVEDVQVVRLKTDQTYSLVEEVKPKGKGKAASGPAKAATSTERISMTIEAIDSSTSPGEQVSKFKETIAQVPYFKANLHTTNGVMLTSLSAPQVGSGRTPFVTFTLQCLFPEKVRRNE